MEYYIVLANTNISKIRHQPESIFNLSVKQSNLPKHFLKKAASIVPS